MRTTFSVSIPVFRQAAFLESALRSVAAQGVSVGLAVLDASPDDAAQRLLPPYERLIAYRYHRADAGQAAAIQEGWDHTDGEVVAWLNADDYYFPDALARVAGVFAARPEVDVVYGHAVHVSPAGDFQMYFPAIEPDPARITHGCGICQPSCFVRRRAVERVGGLDATLRFAMDWDLWVRLYRAGAAFHFLDAPLSAVRIYPETKTLSGGRCRYREIAGVLRTGGVSRAARSAALLGFRYYDLRNRRRTLGETVGYRLLAAAAGLRALAGRRPRRRIAGLECWTNRVEAECVVRLPWYGGTPPGECTVVADRPARLAAWVAGVPATVEPGDMEEATFLGERRRAATFRVALPAQPGPLLSITLRSADGPWRLFSVRPGRVPAGRPGVGPAGPEAS